MPIGAGDCEGRIALALLGGLVVHRRWAGFDPVHDRGTDLRPDRKLRMSPLRRRGLSASVLMSILGSGCLTASTAGVAASTGRSSSGGQSSAGQTSGGKTGGGTIGGSSSSGEPVGAVLSANPSTIHFRHVGLGATEIACTTVTNSSSATVAV